MVGNFFLVFKILTGKVFITTGHLAKTLPNGTPIWRLERTFSAKPKSVYNYARACSIQQ